jgi:hypothetical protein
MSKRPREVLGVVDEVTIVADGDDDDEEKNEATVLGGVGDAAWDSSQ